MINQNIDKLVFNLLKFKNFNIKNIINLSTENFYDKKRNICVKEKTYNTNKFSDFSKCREVTIDLNTYISLSTYIDKKEHSIFLSYQHLYKLKKSLKEVLEFFDNDDFYDDETNEHISPFIETDNGWELHPQFENIEVNCRGLINNKHILFALDTIEDDNNKEEKGVVMFLNSEEAMVKLSEENFRIFADFIFNLNLLQVTQNNLNLAFIINNNTNNSFEKFNSNDNQSNSNIIRKNNLLKKKRKTFREENNEEEN